MRLDQLEENPLLVTEAAWNPQANKEKMIELAFETWNTPAYYTVDKAVLASFAAGKGTSLVIDVGQDSTSIVPIYDGFVLKKGELQILFRFFLPVLRCYGIGIQKSPVCGSLLNSLLYTYLRSTSSTPIHPHYLVKSKLPIEPHLASRAILHTDRICNPADPTSLTTPSYAKYAEMQTMHDFKESCCSMLETTYTEQLAQSKGAKLFEFPDGYNDYYGANPRLVVPEAFHQPQLCIPKEVGSYTISFSNSKKAADYLQQYQTQPRPETSATIPLPTLAEASPLSHYIIKAINACDADLMPQLLSNIVLVGGTTLLPGFPDRLQNELNTLASGVCFLLPLLPDIARGLS